MTNTDSNALTSTMENAISDGIEFFKTNAASDVKIDIWTLREVLCHLIYWHQVTLQGINSVSNGSAPAHIPTSVDEMNARSVGRKSGWEVSRLLDEFRQVHEELVSAVQNMPNPQSVIITMEETSLTVVQILEIMPRHWNEHIAEYTE